MTDLLIVNPPWTFWPGSNMRLGGPPSSVATVAGWFRAQGANVKVLDCMATDLAITLGGHGAGAPLGGHVQCGQDEIAIESSIKRAKAKIVGVSCSWTVQYENAVMVLRAARRAKPNGFVIAGGHDASVRPEAYFAAGFDSVVVGEGEISWDRLRHTASHEAFRTKITAEPFEDLDELPLPAWDLLPVAYYHRAGRQHHGSTLKGGVPLVTSRGCPHACSFCTVHLTMGRKWRAQSPDYVLRHLEHLEKLGFTRFHFEDDNLTHDRERWFEIMSRMEHRGWRWDTPNGVRLDHCTEKMIDRAEASGCVELRVAPESANQATVSGIGKGLDISSLTGVAQCCKAYKLRLSAFWVIGIPGETIEDVRHTLRTAEEMEGQYGVIPRVSIATPFPGTDLLKQCEREGWLRGRMESRTLAGATHGLGMISTPELDAQALADEFHAWNERRGYGVDKKC